MQPKVKVGLLVGAIGLVLNICVAGAVGFCGPVVSLIGGALAGFFTMKQEKPATKGTGAKAGAISGALAGALILIGQVLGAVGALVLFQVAGTQLPFGSIPTPSADASQQMIYYASGMGTGCCFGLVGVVLAALAGAAIAYISTPEQPQAVITQ